MPFFEANACGLPVITVTSPDNAATALIEQGVNGLLSKPNAVSVAENIKLALHEKSKMDPNRYAWKYDWDLVASRAERVIHA